MLDLHRGTINGAMHKSPKGCTSRWRLCLLAGTPAAWASHACDATSLLDVAVGEQFEDQVARSAEASRQIAGHETHVGDDLMFLVKGAHEADRLPMRLCQVDVLLRPPLRWGIRLSCALARQSVPQVVCSIRLVMFRRRTRH